MRFVTLDRPPEGRAGAIIADEILDFGLAGTIFPIASWVPPALTSILAAGDEGLALLRRLVGQVADAADPVKQDLRALGALVPYQGTRLKAPIPRPGILLSHGRAYHDHVAEMKGGPGVPAQPVGFMKNTNSVIGSGAPIVLPASAAGMVDFEGEVSVVFSRPCHGVSADEALDYVLGFTIVNDISARDWATEIKTNPDLNRMGKQFAGFAPMGPCIATLDEIADPANLHMVTRVNGQTMQDAWTRDLIWSLRDLIAYYARWYPFRAGDVLTTGTPAGVGYGRDPKVFLRPGDVVSVTVDGVGELSNTIAAA